SWQKINGEEPVCFGAEDNQYGAFNMRKSGRVKTMKPVHRSGWVRCNDQGMQIWYGQDWKDCSENDGNNGKTCVDVYA
ncbi:uncharacterized protein LOC111320374, partial [Stylophora pistillata]|uniref:uncharacterized protein LOC111320374 n=1 Tax=Stylophora pistillata TaxID=50429 RepID=UPI000C043D54